MPGTSEHVALMRCRSCEMKKAHASIDEGVRDLYVYEKQPTELTADSPLHAESAIQASQVLKKPKSICW